jgi:hypothetical protein
MASDESTAVETTAATKAEEARKQRLVDRTEIVIAILLGMAAILTAWSTFQSAQIDSSISAAYSEGIRLSDAASQAFNDASATDVADQSLFLEYAKAANSGDVSTATYIHDSLMTPELQSAVDWWTNQPDSATYPTPFTPDNPNWSTKMFDDATALDTDAQAKFDEAKKLDGVGSDFDILSIIIALSLFLFGVASLVRQERIKIGLGAVGAVILLFSIIRLIQLGNPAGVTLSLIF